MLNVPNNAGPSVGLFERTGVRYEVACDVMGALIAHYAESMALERDRAQPDEAMLRATQAVKTVLATERDALDVSDAAGIEEAIARYAPLALELYADNKDDCARQAQRHAAQR